MGGEERDSMLNPRPHDDIIFIDIIIHSWLNTSKIDQCLATTCTWLYMYKHSRKNSACLSGNYTNGVNIFGVLSSGILKPSKPSAHWAPFSSGFWNVRWATKSQSTQSKVATYVIEIQNGRLNLFWGLCERDNSVHQHSAVGDIANLLTYKLWHGLQVCVFVRKR